MFFSKFKSNKLYNNFAPKVYKRVKTNKNELICIKHTWVKREKIIVAEIFEMRYNKYK